MAQGQATKIKKKKKSVLKRAAQSRQRAEVNRANRTRVRTLMKRLRTANAECTPSIWVTCSPKCSKKVL